MFNPLAAPSVPLPQNEQPSFYRQDANGTSEAGRNRIIQRAREAARNLVATSGYERNSDDRQSITLHDLWVQAVISEMSLIVLEND